MNQVVHGRESTDELVKKLDSRAKRRFVVCLDEADQLRDTSVLYNLVRSNASVVLIANAEYFLAFLDPRIVSSLWLKRVQFKKYTAGELFDILKERAQYALTPDAADKQVLRFISLVADGDARVALQTLRNAARVAERKTLEKVMIEEDKEALKDSRLSKRVYQLSKLSAHERVLHGLLERNGKMRSGKLSIEYCNIVEDPLQERAYRANMERLVEKGLVIAHGDGKGRAYLIDSI